MFVVENTGRWKPQLHVPAAVLARFFGQLIRIITSEVAMMLRSPNAGLDFMTRIIFIGGDGAANEAFADKLLRTANVFSVIAASQVVSIRKFRSRADWG